MPKYFCGGVVRNLKMKIRRSTRSSLTFPSTMFAVGVGLLFVVYIEVSHSASITVTSDSIPAPSSLEPVVVSSNISAPASPPPANISTKSPSRITTLRSRLGRPFKAKTQRLEVPPPPQPQPGRMKASDIKACISKAFCEVNSASKVPNYAVNKEFFDLMNQIDADRQSEEDADADSGSTSVEYDEDEEEDEEDDDDASSEESSSERLRGYPPGPPPPPGYRFGRKLRDNSTSSVNGTSTTVTSIKVKSSKKKHAFVKKSGVKAKVTGKKMLKMKFANGTLIVVPKRRRTRLEIQEEKKQQEAYLTRKQREMGQVNDLAALIRISADIGLTLRNPKKCRTLFNKCTMSHEQIVDLFNQTLMAVTTPATSNNAPNLSASPTTSYSIQSSTTKKNKVSTTTLKASPPTSPSTTGPTGQYYNELPSIPEKSTMNTVAPTSSLFVTTEAPQSSTTDDNRSSKSRHDFSDEDVEYLTDTEIIQPIQTYSLFVNDAPEESVKTAEEVNVQETFKKYANAFPAESLLPGDLPSLRERNTKKKDLKVNGGSGRSTKTKLGSRRGKPSSEEDEDDDDEDDVGSTSVENRSGFHRSRIDSPYYGYNRDMKEDGPDSGEPASAGKDSNEGILPPLVEREKPYKSKDDEEEEDDEEDSDESVEADVEERRGAVARTQVKSKSKKKGAAKPAVDDDSSEEDDIEMADDHQAPPAPWTPVYQMHMHEKEKKGHKKKQKGPYKGGEGPYDDIPGPPPAPSHSSGGVLSSALNSLKKPWGGSSASHEVGQEPAPHYHRPSSHSQEVPYGDAPYHHGGPQPGGLPYGGGPMSSSDEQKPGFFQSIMSWFSGNKNDPNAPNQPDSPYGAPAGPYGAPGGPYGGQPPYAGGGGSAEHHPQMDDHHEHSSATGAPWPSQPDPAGVGHFGQSHNYRGYRNPESSEEDSLEETLLEKPVKQVKKKRRFRGRSDSIITSPPKKTSTAKKAKTAGGPPPPIVIVPKKDTKSSSQSGGIGVYEQLIQADGGITAGSNMGKKKTNASNKENKRTKKAAIKPKNNQNQTPSKKKRRPSQKSHTNRGARESGEDDDDEVYSSEEIYNQQISKLKTGGSMEIVSLGGGSSNSNGANKAGSSSNNNKNSNKNNGNKQSSPASYSNYFESMFGTEEKDKHTIKGTDDGGLLYGLDALSSHIGATPLELSTVATKKKASTYKVNKNKKKQKKKGTSPPVKFNNKEVVESSEEEDKKK